MRTIKKVTTNERLTARLIEQLKNHPHRDEIVRLATEQLIEDVS